MLQNSITFDELPGAVSSLTALVRELVKEVGELRKMLAPERAIPKSATQFIGIAEACQILGKAQSTVYALARVRFRHIKCLAKRNGDSFPENM